MHGPANGISTCIKGKFAWGHINSEDRLVHPLLRDGDGFREISWDEALDIIEHKFKDVLAKHGPDALAFIASSKCTNEESFLMQKLARAVIGTNNVDNCARYCQNPATRGAAADGGLRRRLRIDLGHRAGGAGLHHRRESRGEPSGAGDAREALAQASRPAADRRRSAQARDGRARRPLLPAQSLDRRRVVMCRFEVHIGSRPGEDGLREQVGEPLRRLQEIAGAVHAGVRGAGHGSSGGHADHGGQRGRGRGRRLHPLRHGRHPALRRFGYGDRALEPVAADRQLHAAGRGRVSAARPQQRAGRERLRLHAQRLLRLPEGRRSRRSREVRGRVGRHPARPRMVSTITA